MFRDNMDSLRVRLDKKKLEKAANVLKCLAHPMRISIIDLLEQRNRMTVTQLQEVLNIEQSLLSHHLITMRDKGIVNTHREGKNIYYSLVDTTLTAIIDLINRGKQV